MSDVLNKITQIQFYLDYIQQHYNNVQKAWNIVKRKCSDMKFIQDDYYFNLLKEEVESHDLSKLSDNEFISYQEKFYPAEHEKKKPNIRKMFKLAFEHHKDNNLHHVENWSSISFGDPYEWQIHCVHMIIDWMAMGYKFNDTAYDFFRKVEKNLNLSEKAIDLINQIFQRLYGKSIKLTEEF